MSERQSERLAVESTEKREVRLQRMSECQSECLALESAKERLQQRRDRLNAETSHEREARLQQIQREREARLQQMRDRLATKTPRERETRLQRMSAWQHERLTEESVQDRVSSSQLYKQRSVQQKMRRFHAYFHSLDSPTCSTCATCSESWTSASQLVNRVCALFLRQTHTKLYSSTNNMDPQ